MSLTPQRLEEIQTLLDATIFKGAELDPLPGDASFRRYIRVKKSDKTAMIMDAPPDKENVRPFVSVAEYLYKHGFSAPAILARNVPGGLLLLEDLGNDSFSSVVRRDVSQEEELYGASIDVLAAWHIADNEFVDTDTLPQPLYNEALLMREVELFSDWYLPQALGAKASSLKQEYLGIWRDILRAAPLSTDQWVHRDYHADNLMWLPKRAGLARVGLLDFQDGVYGDAAYDMVSLLEDARRDVAPELAEKMIARYLAATGAERERFMAAYAILAAQRNSKIVGIFSRLAVRDNKHHYLKLLPRVWKHLENDLNHPALAKLKRWTDAHIAPELRGVIAVNPLLSA